MGIQGTLSISLPNPLQHSAHPILETECSNDTPGQEAVGGGGGSCWGVGEENWAHTQADQKIKSETLPDTTSFSKPHLTVPQEQDE